MDWSKLDYFIERTDARLNEIERKIDSLINFKMKVIGMTALAVGIVEFLARMAGK
jgi:hypothetical protein